MAEVRLLAMDVSHQAECCRRDRVGVKTYGEVGALDWSFLGDG